jgi:uncharacterized membrane protein YgcG
MNISNGIFVFCSLFPKNIFSLFLFYLGPQKDISTDFDFESHLEDFKTALESSSSSTTTTALNPHSTSTSLATTTSRPVVDNKVYIKDDFFDSISCDVLDRQRGLDNRLRGSQERSLNTETFGAVSLSHSLGGSGGRGGGGRGRGGGGRFGRGGGRTTGREEGGERKENDKNPRNTSGTNHTTKRGGGYSRDNTTRRREAPVSADK